MSNFKVSEMFYSLQGEGFYVGTPSVFLRMFGCNLRCEGFGMPPGEISRERFDLRFDPKEISKYKTLHDLPLVSTGCDSYGSWDPRFKHLSPTYSAKELADRLARLVPKQRWMKAEWNSVHLVITGGESLLRGWQRQYPELLDLAFEDGLSQVTFETNGTQPLVPEFAKYIADSPMEFTFSISPKLSASGEDPEITVKPEVVTEYEKVGDIAYLKFVCNSFDHFEEVKRVMNQYREAGFDGDVYIMPEGGMAERYKHNTKKVAELCLRNRFKYSPRLHVDLWGNSWAT